jgi:glycosyltransferase involved in cell wall biosynthesis
MITSFSIVTPSYSQTSYLELCSKSVADQRGPFSVEHIVQEGAGGDEFEAWRRRQKSASVYFEKDSGMYDAINRGFLRANGELIAWLNCDEQYLDGTLSKVAQWFESNPHRDILFGDIILIDSHGSPLSYRKALLPMRGHIKNCFLPTFSAATFLRRRVLDEGYFLDTRFRAISDMVWIYELLGKGFTAGVLNQPLATFAQTGANLGQSEACVKEALQWNQEQRSSRIGAVFWSTVHRSRKLLAGAYRKRDIEISIYEHGSEDRVPKRTRVGGWWVTGA